MVVALCASVTLVASGSAATGQDRVLAVLATPGPTPYSTTEFKQVASEVDAFFRASSFGREHLSFDVTPWLDAFQTTRPTCGGFSDRSMDGAVAPAPGAAPPARHDPHPDHRGLDSGGGARRGVSGV